MELIILNDGLYQLIPVTKEILDGIVLTSEIDCFDLCDILRVHLTMYHESWNTHIMKDGSGDFIGCICLVPLGILLCTFLFPYHLLGGY